MISTDVWVCPRYGGVNEGACCLLIVNLTVSSDRFC